MPIYTKTGDKGHTISFDQTPTRKSSQRIHTIGSVDELNSTLGVVSSLIEDDTLLRILELVQKDLFLIGSYLSGKEDAIVAESRVSALEAQIDEWEQSLPQLTNFILPGGSHAAAIVHQSRSICRRAERELVAYHEENEVHQRILMYINRLSDWLFMLARYINISQGSPEKIWKSS